MFLGGTGLLTHLSPAPKSGISGLYHHYAWLSYNSLLEDISHDVVKDYGTDGKKDVFMLLHACRCTWDQRTNYKSFLSYTVGSGD